MYIIVNKKRMHTQSLAFTDFRLNEIFGIIKFPNGFDEKKEVRKILTDNYTSV